MKRKVLGLLALATLCMSGSLHAGAIENWFGTMWKAERPLRPAVGVLIVHDQDGVVLEVKGKYKLYDPNTNAFVSTRFVGKRKFIQAMTDGLKWGEEFPGVHQIKIVPDDAKTTTVVDGVEYKGNIYVYDIGGTISVVNEVFLDDYVQAVLAATYQEKLPEELTAALAIAARTQAWYQAENSSSKYWGIEASKVGYQGNAATAASKAIVDAVKTTKDMVLTKNGVPFPVEWGNRSSGSYPQRSDISLNEAEQLANSGKDAAEILSQAFPGSSITLIQSIQ